MQRGLRNVVLVGDQTAKLDFLCEFLDEACGGTLRKECSIASPMVETVHSERFVDEIAIDKDGNNILILSAGIPSGVKVSADFSETDWIYCPNVHNASLVLFIETFPFTSDTMCVKIELIEEFLMRDFGNQLFQGIQFRVVFFKDKDQHFGDTDRVGIDEALKCAPDNMTRRLEKSHRCMLPVSSLIDFKIYEKPIDLIDIVSCNMKTFKTLTSVSGEKLKRWRDDMEYYHEEYRLEYNDQFADSLRSEEIYNKITKFSAVKGCNDIIKRYVENYRRNRFDKVKKIAVDEYRKCVWDICFWDIDRDITALGSRLDKLCTAVLVFEEQLPCPRSKAAYQEILAGKKIDIKFSERINDLEQEQIPNLVYQYLQEKEEILFGVFKE